MINVIVGLITAMLLIASVISIYFVVRQSKEEKEFLNELAKFCEERLNEATRKQTALKEERDRLKKHLEEINGQK